MCATIFNQVNSSALRAAREQLAEAIQCYDRGDYDRSFYFFSRSVEKSCALLSAVGGEYLPGEIFTDPRMKAYQIDEQFEAMAELLGAFEQEDEKLDLLHAFLTDSGPEALAGTETRYRLFLYRQMLLSFVAEIDNHCFSSDDMTDSDQLESLLNLKFALAAYLESLMAYQQWCLEFIEENGLRHDNALAGAADEVESRRPSWAM